MPSYLVTGASRGLGLAFVTELLKNKDNTVFATARDTAGSSGLQELKAQHQDGRVVFLDLDVTSSQSIQAAAEKVNELSPNGLDHLVNNAGVFLNGLKTFDELDIETFQKEVIFNITVPLLMLQHFLPLVRKSQAKKIMFITSGLGSVEAAPFTPNLANGYSVAKAALNMLVRKYGVILKNDGITTFLCHPGYVDSTDMGQGILSWIDKYAPNTEKLPIEESAADCMKILNQVTIEDNGKFFNHDGSNYPF